MQDNNNFNMSITENQYFMLKFIKNYFSYF